MNILFITSNRAGDAVLSTGILQYFIELHPGASITIAAGPVAAPLFSEIPGCHKIIILDKNRYRTHWVKLWCLCVLHRWDIIIDLRRSIIKWLLLAGES